MDYEPQDGTFDSTGSLTSGSPHDSTDEAIDVVGERYREVGECVEWVKDYLRNRRNVEWEQFKNAAIDARHDVDVLITDACDVYRVKDGNGKVTLDNPLRWCHDCEASFRRDKMSRADCGCPECGSHNVSRNRPHEVREREYRTFRR